MHVKLREWDGESWRWKRIQKQEKKTRLAQLALFFSAGALTPVVVLFVVVGFCFFFLAHFTCWFQTGWDCSHGCKVCFTSTGQAGNSIPLRKDFRGPEIPGISQILPWRGGAETESLPDKAAGLVWNNQRSNNMNKGAAILTLLACFGVYFRSFGLMLWASRTVQD